MYFSLTINKTPHLLIIFVEFVIRCVIPQQELQLNKLYTYPLVQVKTLYDLTNGRYFCMLP